MALLSSDLPSDGIKQHGRFDANGNTRNHSSLAPWWSNFLLNRSTRVVAHLSIWQNVGLSLKNIQNPHSALVFTKSDKIPAWLGAGHTRRTFPHSRSSNYCLDVKQENATERWVVKYGPGFLDPWPRHRFSLCIARDHSPRGRTTASKGLFANSAHQCELNLHAYRKVAEQSEGNWPNQLWPAMCHDCQNQIWQDVIMMWPANAKLPHFKKIKFEN